MRVLVVDPDPARAALVAEGLAGVEPLQVRHVIVFDQREAAAFEPDVIVVASDSPDRDTIESLREATAANPRPVVMFVDRSEAGLAEEAAYRLLRKLYMDTGRPLGAVAADLLAFAGVLKGQTE